MSFSSLGEWLSRSLGVALGVVCKHKLQLRTINWSCDECCQFCNFIHYSIMASPKQSTLEEEVELGERLGRLVVGVHITLVI